MSTVTTKKDEETWMDLLEETELGNKEIWVFF